MNWLTLPTTAVGCDIRKLAMPFGPFAGDEAVVGDDVYTPAARPPHPIPFLGECRLEHVMV